MRLHSTPESVQRGEVSLLAILETLVAITLVFYLSAHFNTLAWLAMAICVAPLLLLRTEESVRLGCRIFDWIFVITNHRSLEADEAWSATAKNKSAPFGQKAKALFIKLLSGSALALVGSIGAAVVRISATLVTMFRYPLKTIRAIPENWGRVTTSTDIFILPEIVPGHDETSFSDFLRHVATLKRESTKTKILALIYYPIGVPPLFLPAILYRWSLKATSIIYAPLVFIVHTTFRNVKNLRTKLELIKRSDLSRIGALYALLFITAFLVKLILMLTLPGFAAWWNTHPVGEFLALYIAPAEIPMWQVASLINSSLALVLLFFARHTLLRFELGEPVNETAIQRLLGLTTGLRLILTLYTILCTAYITLNTARGLPWPKIGEKWVPWG